MAISGEWIGGSKSQSPWREIRITVTEKSVSTSNNTSTIEYHVYLDNGSTSFSQVKIGCKVIIDGVTVMNRAYSSSSQYTCGRNSSVEIASGTTTVTHNSNGTKTIASGSISATCSSAGIVDTQTVTSNTALTLTQIARASSVSISTNTTVMGKARTITITKSDSSFRHKLYYKFATQTTNVQITSSYITGTTQSWTPPVDLAALLTNAKSGTGTITCETYTSSGTSAIGTSTCSFTATIPATTPTVTGGTWIGDRLTIGLSSRASDNITHKLTYKFATQSAATQIAASAGDSYAWTPTTAQKKAMVEAVSADNASGSGTITCTTYNGTAEIGTTTKTWTGKIPASSGTVPSTAITLGATKTFTVSRAGNNLTHKISYTLANASGTSLATGTVGTGITTSKSWTVPTSLASKFTNASSGVIKTTITTYNGTAVCGSAQSISSNFTVNAPASTMTFSASSVAMGTGSLKITINRATTNMTHTVEYKFSGDSTYTQMVESAGDSATWNSNNGLTYARGVKIPDATSGTWTIRLTTKIGTAQVGTYTRNVTLTIPNNSDTRPQVRNLSFAPVPTNASASGNSSFSGMYITEFSKVQASLTPVTRYGSTVRSIALIVGGSTARTGEGTSGTATTIQASKVLSSSGTIKVSVKVTDSRGFVTQSDTTQITAYEYSEPTVTPKSGASKIVCGRWDTDAAKLSSSGEYLHIEARKAFSSLNSQNACTLTYTVYDSSGTQTASATLSSSTFTSSAKLLADITSTYRVVLTASDTFGNSNSYAFNIPSDQVSADFRVGGKGLGLGMYSQGANRLDVAWDEWVHNYLRPKSIRSYNMNATGPTNMIVVPGYSYSDLGFSASVSYPYSGYLEEWLKRIITDYAAYSMPYMMFIGLGNPSQRIVILCTVYDMTATDNGLPTYCTGLAYSYANQNIVRFRTYGGTLSVSEILEDAATNVTLSYTSNSYVASEQFENLNLVVSGKTAVLSGYFTTTNTATASFQTIGTVQSGYRPSKAVYIAVPANSTTHGHAVVSVNTAGNIRLVHNYSTAHSIYVNLSWIIA